MPSAELIAWCKSQNVDAMAIADEFRDFWIAIPGAKGVKLDWSATFRNRVRVLIGLGRAPAPRASPRIGRSVDPPLPPDTGERLTGEAAAEAARKMGEALASAVHTPLARRLLESPSQKKASGK